ITVGQTLKYESVQQWDAALPVLPVPTLDNTYGIGYTTTAGFTGTPQAVFYDAPGLARRSAYYQNFSLGLERQVLPHTLVSVDYAGSLGHFLPNNNAPGIYSDQVAPQYLVLGTALNNAATTANITAANAILAANGMSPIALPYSNYSTSAPIGQMLRPWPMYSITNNFPQDGNSAYNAVQVSVKQQAWKGLSLTVNYTYSRLIDDLAQRTSTYVKTNKWNVDSGPQALKIYGSWVTPGYTSDNRWVRGATKGWTLSSIYTYTSALPLTYSTSCGSQFGYFGACRVSLNPSFSGPLRSNVSWGPANFTQSAFTSASAFTTSTTAFGNAPYANAYGVTGPGSYSWDGSVRRTVALWEKTRFTIGADVFNITNHTEVAASNINTNITSTAFGTASKQSNASRDIQLNAKIEF
ncbi:MAG TPA: hypothetical protein VF214_05420, partial [Edaphobacter sp.]